MLHVKQKKMVHGAQLQRSGGVALQEINKMTTDADDACLVVVVAVTVKQ